VSEEPRDEDFDWVPLDRRALLKRMVVATTFAVPVVSSFSMQSLSMNVAAARTNMTSP